MPKTKSIQKRSGFYFRWGIALLLLLAIGYAFLHYQKNKVYAPVEMRELPEGFSQHGIDVSHYQGKIDWDGLFSSMDSTLEFVYCKATEGVRFVDPQWKRNEKALRESTTTRHGAYHFFSPHQNAELQAEHYLNVVQPLSGSLPPVLDAETEGPSDAILIRKMKTWLAIVQRQTGVRPIIYTSYHFYRTKFKGKFPGYKFWIASYNPNVRRVKHPDILIWQYSDRGNIPGISGFVDLNMGKSGF